MNGKISKRRGPIIERIPEDKPTTWLSNLVVTPKKLKPGQTIEELEYGLTCDT